jgi:hypothetical protein
MYSQSLIGDDALLDKAMVEARCLFQRESRRCWSLAAATGFGECGNPRDSFIFFCPLGFCLQSFQDNYFLLICLVALCLFTHAICFSINEICGCSQKNYIGTSKVYRSEQHLMGSHVYMENEE